jgi:hypothetical protein
MSLLSHRTFTKKITFETKEISCALYLNKKYEEIASQPINLYTELYQTNQSLSKLL